MTIQRNDESESVFHGSPMEMVREGMTVVDRAGERLGTVAHIQMGDAQAATTRGNEEQTPGLLGDVARVFVGTEPDVPEPLRSQLVRHGYIKIDAAGLLSSDRYVRGDKLASVRDDTVHLRVTKEQLPEEE